MQSGFWKADWVLGVAVAARFALFTCTPSDKAAVIAIDKQSIDNIGRWPWSRDAHAKIHRSLLPTSALARSGGIDLEL